jgi:hypothetical protein
VAKVIEIIAGSTIGLDEHRVTMKVTFVLEAAGRAGGQKK